MAKPWLSATTIMSAVLSRSVSLRTTLVPPTVLWAQAVPEAGGPAAQFRPFWDVISAGMGRPGCCWIESLCKAGLWHGPA